MHLMRRRGPQHRAASQLPCLFATGAALQAAIFGASLLYWNWQPHDLTHDPWATMLRDSRGDGGRDAPDPTATRERRDRQQLASQPREMRGTNALAAQERALDAAARTQLEELIDQAAAAARGLREQEEREEKRPAAVEKPTAQEAAARKAKEDLATGWGAPQQQQTSKEGAALAKQWPKEQAASPAKECQCVNCEEDKLCGGLWKGFRHPSNNHEMLQVHVLVSHCHSKLDWLEEYMRPAVSGSAARENQRDKINWWEQYIRPKTSSTASFEIASIHVISKCGQYENIGAPPTATHEVLPNVGRCDHTYAHYISRALRDRWPPDREDDTLPRGRRAASPVVVFLKDDVSRSNMHQGHARRNTFAEMVALATANGFACGITPTRWSAFHEKKSFFGFHLDKYERNEKDYEGDGVKFRSAYKNVGHYFRNITSFNVENAGAPHPVPALPDIVQVCYGGVFATTLDRLRAVKAHVWDNLELTLTRGDSIQEGHYAERSWAMLLAAPLAPYEEEAVRRWATGGIRPYSVLGALFHKKEPKEEGAK